MLGMEAMTRIIRFSVSRSLAVCAVRDVVWCTPKIASNLSEIAPLKISASLY